jgi:4-amino-4-deoxychorismate lyase
MYWYDGQLIDKDTIELSIRDSGLLYGATVFTTMRVYERELNHSLTNWNAHCDRLRQSLEAFSWQMPNWENLQKGANILSWHFHILRIAIFPDGRELITGRSLPEYLSDRQQNGITAWVAEGDLFERSQSIHKTGNYLGAMLALQAAQKLEAKEAILIDELGNWLETSTGNLWGYRDNCYWTPSLDSGILPGTARSNILKFLKNKEIPVYENIWTPDFVANLEAIAYSNCVVQIVPIVTVLDRTKKLSFNQSNNIFRQLNRESIDFYLYDGGSVN